MEISELSPQRKIIDEWCERVWAQEDANAIDELFEDDGIVGGLGRENLAGPKEFRQFHTAMCALISDIRLEVVEHIEKDNKVACLCTVSGKYHGKEGRVSANGSMFFEFRNGKILNAENHFEFIDFFEQLGLFPNDSFAKALQGKAIC
jgi:predicted ester cyclase